VRETRADVDAFVKRAWLLAYSRTVSHAELRLARDFIAASEAAHTKAGTADARATALREFCLSVMNTTEFIYSN